MNRHFNRQLGVLLVLTLTCFSCESLPEADSLPEQEVAIETPEGQENEPSTENEQNQPAGPKFTKLRYKDVRGGRITVEIPGTPSQVEEALLDFANAAGNRAWAREYRTIKTEGDEIWANWKFDGKMGINPDVDLHFRRGLKDGARRLRFRLSRKAYGLAAFFGDYQLREAKPGYTSLRAQVFIDSGLWIANASFDEIRDGLVEDAKLLDAWMKKRLDL